MSNRQTRVSKPRFSFSVIFLKVLSFILPNRMKRLLLLVSLYQYIINHSDHPQKDAHLKELNKQLRLATQDDDALLLGTLFSEPLWSSTDIKNIMDIREKGLASVNLDWLSYGRKSDLDADLNKMQLFIESHA